MSGISGAIVVLGIAGLLAGGAGEASASHVSCGDEIAADTTLDSDLANCPNNGVLIGADDVTLDLNGHTIDGDGTEFAGCTKGAICDTGVANDGHNGVTVRDGRVREFAVGVLVGGARENRVLKIVASRHAFFGVVVGGSARSVIRDSSLSRNIAPEGDGLGVFASDRIRIVHNRIRRNPGPGIHLAESAENLIERNVFSRNGPAILIEDANRNRVQRNGVRRGGGIIVAPGNGNAIVRNRLSRAMDSISVEGGSGNLVAGNVVANTPTVGIRLGFVHPPIGGDHNVVRGNVVRGGGDDGFVVAAKDDDSVLKRNVARRNQRDGFDIASKSAKLADNLAVRNGSVGIEAVAGVTDGGGNSAHGNGGSAQCINISC